MGDATNDNHKFSELKQAVTANNLDKVREIISSLATRNWCRNLINNDYPLLHEAILLNRKEIFNFMLPYHDMIDLETQNHCGETALQFTLNIGQRDKIDHYAIALIKKGAYIHGNCKDGSLLHITVKYLGVEVSKLLLSKGINVNVVDSYGRTALLKMLYNKSRQLNEEDELVTALLCHGADPFIRSPEGYNAFEFAIMNDHSALIQETLFNYTYLPDGGSSIDLEVLLHLALSKSVMFHQVARYKVRHPNSVKRISYVILDLLMIPTESLNILLQNRSFCTLVSNVHWQPKTVNVFQRHRKNIPQFLQSCRKFNKYDFIKSQDIMTKIDLLLESTPGINFHMLNFISELNSVELCNHLINSQLYNENTITELMMFMFKIGLRCSNRLLDIVFTEYGYCELFKFLLTLDLEEFVSVSPLTCPQNVVVSFICDPRLKLEEVLKNFDDFSKMSDCPKLLRYFANCELYELLSLGKQEQQISLLVEMARNTFRRYLMEKFKLTTAKEFFSVVRALPICEVHKKIITFETPLYR